MGMYTNLVLGVTFKDTAAKYVADTLEYMTGQKDESVLNEKYLNHELFQTEGWRDMLRMDAPGFGGRTRSYLSDKESLKFTTLSVRSSLKNYNNEVQLFLDWLHPHLLIENSLDHFAGFFRCEDEVHPTLIYFKSTGVVLRQLSDN